MQVTNYCQHLFWNSWNRAPSRIQNPLMCIMFLELPDSELFLTLFSLRKPWSLILIPFFWWTHLVATSFSSLKSSLYHSRNSHLSCQSTFFEETCSLPPLIRHYLFLIFLGFSRSPVFLVTSQFPSFRIILWER